MNRTNERQQPTPGAFLWTVRPAALTGVLLLVAAPGVSAQICPPELASVNSGGTQGFGDADARNLSADGRFVAFDTRSALDPMDTNGTWDAYVRDRVTGITELVSSNPAGWSGNGISGNPTLSADGNLVSFVSNANNLVPGDTGIFDIFVRDRAAGTTEKVSVDSNGAAANGPSFFHEISADGRWVVFDSEATNLAPNDANGEYDYFLRDRLSGTTTLVSVAQGGGSGNGESCCGHGISGDGRWVAFQSGATDLVPGGSVGLQIFLRDTVNGTTILVSAGASGTGGDSGSWEPFVSEDGRFIVFYSDASDLVPGDLNSFGDMFMYHRESGTTELVSLAHDGAQGNFNSGWNDGGWTDRNGRYVVFDSVASNLVPGDTNGARDIFVRDRWAQTTTRLSVGPGNVQANLGSYGPQISADGSTVVFASAATNLVPNDMNGSTIDIFVEACPGPAGATFCFGDGSGTQCPCANPSSPGEGCANSSGSGGLLQVGGTTSAAADDLSFEASQLLSGQPGLLFVANDALNNGDGVSFGDGLRCAGNGLVRLGIETPDAAGLAGWGPGLGAIGGWTAGDTRRFQVWYRDPAGPCGSGFNLTHGTEVIFGP